MITTLLNRARNRSPRPALWLLIGLLGLAQPRHARAEDSVSFKYQDYREAEGRIAVQVRSALFEKDLGTAMQLRITGVMDTIAGATPNGRPPSTPGGPVALAHMEEVRKAWSLDFSRQFSAVRVSAGVANSRESDYVSTGWSLNTLTDFNAKNTTLVLGVAGTLDDVKVFFQQPHLAKRTADVILGINQLLDPRTAVTFDVTYSHAAGYLGDPYKLVEKNVEVVPGIFLLRTYSENRPTVRDKWLVYAGLNRAYPGLHGAAEASYRFHRDNFGMVSHTLSLAWFQKFGDHFTLNPSVRCYGQSAADFYYVTLTGTPIVPPSRPSSRAPFYSADYRLSEMTTVNYGLKAIWAVTDAWQVDAAVEYYDMRGHDGNTSATAYPRATTITGGVRFAF